MLGEARAGILDLCCLDEVAPSLASEKGEGAKLAAIFKMDEDFASDAFLILNRMFLRELRTEFEERFPSVGGFAVNAADEANQLVPGLSVRVTVFAGVNSGELPLVFSGKRIDRLGQAGSEGFQLIGRTLSRAGLPEIATQVEVFHTEASALADGAFEVFGAWKIVELGEVAGKFGFVFARNGDIGAVKVGQFTRRKRQRSHGGDRAGNPAERVLFLGDFASGVGGGQRLTGDDNVAIFVGTGVGELVSDIVEFFQEVRAFGFQFLPFDFERARVGTRQPFRNGADCALQLFAAVQIAFEKADAEWAQFRNDVMAHHAQGLGGVAGDKDAFPLGQKVTDQISDGVRFPRTRRALNQHAAVLLKLPGNANLLGVCRLAEKNRRVDFAVAIRRRIGFSRVRKRRFLANDIQKRPGQIFARAKVGQNAFDGGGESQSAAAQE